MGIFPALAVSVLPFMHVTHALKFYCPRKLACDRGEDSRILSQIRSEPHGQGCSTAEEMVSGI